jgi:hypothetical protein
MRVLCPQGHSLERLGIGRTRDLDVSYCGECNTAYLDESVSAENVIEFPRSSADRRERGA